MLLTSRMVVRFTVAMPSLAAMLNAPHSPCVLGRFLVAGNVKETPLRDLFASGQWREILACVPEQNACVTCTPGDSNDCNPSRKPA